MDDPMRLLRWQDKETGLWLVAHPKLDVISQGRTGEEAYNSFMHALAMTVLFVVDDRGCATLRLAPDDVAAKWAAEASPDGCPAPGGNDDGR